jgi:hypothetical protein
MDHPESKNDPKEPSQKSDVLNNYRTEAAEKAVAKLEQVRAMKALSNGDSQWTLVQEILQEIQAAYIVKDPDVMPKTTKLVVELKSEIEKRYADEPETKQILLDGIPAERSVREWLKKDGWEEAVWSKIRQDGLFTSAKRAQVIESLRTRALDKSDVAAKIWLTLSGDYSEKMEVDSRSVDMYREINSVLHKKKE